ncbi:precorrin-6y C5,15-methyltransferase (decarboxylating) subunit CbiE [Nocardioides sp. JQ2195]|uniref:precorrin-6y C5,15-methyltransferase (decarboxylating) subunit CbiE n=1 Tax=Nocardioides sp. JQ2195 TaxID=2592334 RepID=UPI00143E411D|nr:precorrin-6y C5,15-methyltransferase (decarboxylating) subunit CbiE [Nocardioides sp. JQ2195]QIX27740.1 precorrin-6y C5,15-methyltransferase (decarboxylating) subunit CbiE [Nocardioides sp. JQ2195]
MSSAVTVIGIGADGWPGLPAAQRERVLRAEVVLGGDRHLAMLPDAPGQVRESWPSPLRDGLPALLWKHDGKRVVALASGDPFVSGIGGTLVELLGRGAVAVEPAVSSVALARARMGWDAEMVEVVSLVGRDVHAVLRALAPGHRLVVLSSDARTPAAVAALLDRVGYGASTMTVLGDLGSRDETRMVSTAAAWDLAAPQLNVIALALVGPVIGGWAAGLPDDAFEHDGQLTKRDLRASALARLAPTPAALLWDVGAGAGSVGIEWMRAHPTCRTIAVESNPERAARITRNAQALGVPALEVVEGRAPEALDALARPDAIFVGGGATAPSMVENCLAALGPGGRLVVHGVTVETEAVLAAAHREHGGELTRHQVETAAPIGTFTGWTPARTVTQWAHTKESS